jgi:WD40 repeat protein
MIEPLHTFRGHTGPLFSVTVNNAQQQEDTRIYSAGSEGVIRIWKVPSKIPDPYSRSNGKNFCMGVFSSHKDVVW